ncbi:MAG: AAA family ATPase [Acidobacteriota bacterium]|nr:AAA family ATPase [Acidobacteriota bacterium]
MNTDLELAVLGALVIQPTLIESCDLTDSDFPAGRLRSTFQAISELWEEGRPKEIDPLLLARRLGGKDGDSSFVSSLYSGQIKLDAGDFCRRVFDMRKHQITLRIFMEINDQAKSGVLDINEILPDLDKYDAIQHGHVLDPSDVLIPGSTLQSIETKVEWTAEKLIPRRALTLLHGPGGLGKTWLALCLAKAVSGGVPFLGLTTMQRRVIYVDFENPWPQLIERVKKLNIRDVLFWHLSFNPRPPKLDSRDWELYKKLPAESLLIFDTTRAAHDGDENSSQDVSLFMGRLKEIRELDNDVLLLHHTTKLNERASKGSTAWSDLADHVLSFYKVKKCTLEEIEDGCFDPHALLSLGTGKKTRYEPFRMFLTLDPDAGGFTIAEDPNVSAIDAIAKFIAGDGAGKNQSEIIEWAKATGIGPKMRGSFITLLNRGEGKWWRSHKGFKGARFYEPIS